MPKEASNLDLDKQKQWFERRMCFRHSKYLLFWTWRTKIDVFTLVLMRFGKTVNIWTSKYNGLGTTGPICTSKYNGFEQLEAPKVHLHKQNQWFGTHLARFHEQASPASLQQEKNGSAQIRVLRDSQRGLRTSVATQSSQGVLLGPPIRFICTSKYTGFEQFDTPKS